MTHSKELKAAFCIFDFTNSNHDDSKCILDSALEKKIRKRRFDFRKQ